MTIEDAAELVLRQRHVVRLETRPANIEGKGTVKQRQLVNYGATSMTTLLQMVSHGMGLTLIPEIAVRTEASRNNVRILAFADPEPSREIGLIWRRQSERRDDFEALAATIVECGRRLLISADELDDLAA